MDITIFQFYYTGIRVRDLKRSLDFYAKVIGLKVVGRGTMPHGGKYVHLRGRGSKQMLELNWCPEGSKFYSEYAGGDELDHLRSKSLSRVAPNPRFLRRTRREPRSM